MLCLYLEVNRLDLYIGYFTPTLLKCRIRSEIFAYKGLLDPYSEGEKEEEGRREKEEQASG